jgi:hypothetical protein
MPNIQNPNPRLVILPGGLKLEAGANIVSDEAWAVEVKGVQEWLDHGVIAVIPEPTVPEAKVMAKVAKAKDKATLERVLETDGRPAVRKAVVQKHDELFPARDPEALKEGYKEPSPVR